MFLFLKGGQVSSSFIRIKCGKALLDKVACYYINQLSFNDSLPQERTHHTDNSKMVAHWGKERANFYCLCIELWSSSGRMSETEHAFELVDFLKEGWMELG